MNIEEMDEEDLILYLQGAQDALSAIWLKDMDIEEILNRIAEAKKDIEILSAPKRMDIWMR